MFYYRCSLLSGRGTYWRSSLPIPIPVKKEKEIQTVKKSRNQCSNLCQLPDLQLLHPAFNHYYLLLRDVVSNSFNPVFFLYALRYSSEIQQHYVSYYMLRYWVKMSNAMFSFIFFYVLLYSFVFFYILFYILYIMLLMLLPVLKIALCCFPVPNEILQLKYTCFSKKNWIWSTDESCPICLPLPGLS